ncbi:MAG: ATP-binding protein [Lachnospiraceae bacterium]
MKKKINKYFATTAVFSILLTVLVMTVIFYFRLRTQVFSDLKIIAELLTADTEYENLPKDIRVTLIDRDGTVLYDSAVDTAELQNHRNRPEVEDALEKGFGQSIRRSDTLAKSVFYYALLMENGQVLRVGREAASVVWVLLSAIPIIIIMSLLVLAVCMFISHCLTSAIVAPIDKMVEDMDHMEEEGIYEELIPFTRKIRSQHEEILSAANIRQEFTTNVSHELKTPLTVILGYSELMESGVVKEADIKHFSHEIGKSATRLLSLINDIIKLSQLDAGEQEDMLEIVDLAVIAGDTVEMLSMEAVQSDVTMAYTGSESAKIRIGKELAEELTYNLIENAIRYNRPGGKVNVSVKETEEGLVFTVADTGIGIPKESQERIFERFYRVDKSRSKELGGTGLGLAIVKHICSLTGGKLSLDSEVGRGTTIKICWEDTAIRK